MPTRERVEELRLVHDGLSREARRLVRRLLTGIDLADGALTVETLLTYLPDVIRTYGEASADVSGAFYALLRDEAGVPGDFYPRHVAAASNDQIRASTRWAVSPLFPESGPVDERALLVNLDRITDRLVKMPGRDTLTLAAVEDPVQPRYARIPTGATTCVFCAMLASRGAVYLSRESAGELSRFHDLCDCGVLPVWEHEQLPEGYDPDHYMQVYQDHGGAAINLKNRYNEDGSFRFSERIPTID